MPTPGGEEPRDEIVTIGRRLRRFDNFRLFELASFPSGFSGADIEREGERFAFIPPAVPGVIEEITTTAKRVPKGGPLTVPRPGSVAARTGLAGIIGAGLGFIVAEFLREVSQTRLDEAGQLATRPVLPGPDTPVVVTRPQVLPEVVVTGSRTTGLLEALRRYVIPPTPQFFPREADPDPFIMQPIGPAPVLPRPEVRPDVVTIPRPQTPATPRVRPAPPRFPFVIPSPLPTPTFEPFRAPRPAPAPSPSPLPIPTPTPFPIGQPVPAPRARPQPRPGQRPKPFSPTRPLTQVRPGPLPFPLQQPKRPRNCPPCPKEDETPEIRTECYKKLVKEGLTPDLDESFNWVEIDCLTGKEL